MKAVFCLMAFIMLMFNGQYYSIFYTDEIIYYGGEYNGAVFVANETEYIVYDSKTENEYSLNGGLPRYYDSSYRVNIFANFAGTIILGYYDKDFPEMIPNFTSTRIIKDRVLYSAQTQAVQVVIDSLYAKMETNSTSAGGTSVEGFIYGLKSYVAEKGNNIKFDSIGNNGTLNKEMFVNSIQTKRPVALFVSGYNLISIGDLSVSDNMDKLAKAKYSGNHVLISYGIKEINYYDSNGKLKKQLILLMVATGYNQDPLYYIDVTDGGFIEGYSVNIY